jgi:hypothetical protein
MKYQKLLFSLIFLLILQSKKVAAQTGSYFEGVLYTHCSRIDAQGKSSPFVWEEIERYYDENHILTRITKGRSLDNRDRSDIYLDIEKSRKLKINHDSHLISILSFGEAKDFPTLEFKKMGEEDFLGYACDVYFIKYVDRLEDIREIIGDVSDTLSCTYYIAKDLKIKNPKNFAKLQGNRSTNLLDGRFDGVALKIIMEHTNREKLVMMATKVEKRNVQEVMVLPPYPFRN